MAKYLTSNLTIWAHCWWPYLYSPLAWELGKIEKNQINPDQIRFFSDHQNWFGTDENLGPLAISIRREKVPAHPNAAELFLTPRNLDPDKDFREQVSWDECYTTCLHDYYGRL